MNKCLVIFEADVLFVDGETKLDPNALGILESIGFLKVLVSKTQRQSDYERVSLLCKGNWFDSHFVPNVHTCGAKAGIYRYLRRFFVDAKKTTKIERIILVAQDRLEIATGNWVGFTTLGITRKTDFKSETGGWVPTHTADSLHEAGKIICRETGLLDFSSAAVI